MFYYLLDHIQSFYRELALENRASLLYTNSSLLLLLILLLLLSLLFPTASIVLIGMIALRLCLATAVLVLYSCPVDTNININNTHTLSRIIWVEFWQNRNWWFIHQRCDSIGYRYGTYTQCVSTIDRDCMSGCNVFRWHRMIVLVYAKFRYPLHRRWMATPSHVSNDFKRKFRIILPFSIDTQPISINRFDSSYINSHKFSKFPFFTNVTN